VWPIITGSSRGIGAAIAREFCRRGHLYYGFSRWNDVDVSDYSSVKREFEGFYHPEQHLPEVLINNAGIVELGSVLELTPEDWEKQFAVNLHGVFYCCKEYVKLLRAKDKPGKIINIASTSGMLTPRPGRSAYAASKAAVISFSLSLAEELRPYGIKVYCVAPGACNTDLRKAIYPDDNFDNMMQPADLARFVVDIAEGGEMLDNQVLIARGL
jgi:3-oxoacyl-[acyl-carrier protein] reductase